MPRDPTLESTLHAMKTVVKYDNGTSSKESAVRSIAEKSAVADVLEILEERVDASIDLREEGINILIDEFESEYPDFNIEAPQKESRLKEWVKKGRDAKPGDWKDEYKEGLGPGVFTVDCSAENQKEIADVLDELFPHANTRVLNYQVSVATSGRTRVMLRLDDTVDVDQLPDHLSIDKIHETGKLQGEQ